MSDPLHDTIVATATPQGRGALAVVRLSGPRAAEILLAVAPELEGLPPARRATLARILHPSTGEPADRALVTWYPGPGSYTGEDAVEISGHGGGLAPRLVEEACRAAGARRAEPGEFTRRAFLAGKVDMVQAEAVADLVEARSRALHRNALRQLEGGLSRRLAALRDSLIDLEALLTHHLDFPEEDDAPVPVGDIVGRARQVTRALERLEATAPEGELLREGALVVLAGRPNVGKSSLFNALLGEERALVTEIPGTTRDAVEVQASVGGYPFRLVDTAGLRETDETVERLGIEVAQRFLRAADVVLFCAEAGRPLQDAERAFMDRELRASGPVVRVRTKADEGEERPEAPWIAVSVRSGEGLDVLRNRLRELVFGSMEAGDDAPVLTRERQVAGVRRAGREVTEFADALEGGVPAEMAATHLRSAETALEETLGVLSPEEVLDRLFSSFCIGK